MVGRRLLRSYCAVKMAATAWLVPALGVAAGPPVAVTITGGSDAIGQQYRWVVTNDDPSPIVAVEFPHFRAGLFVGPDGWTSDCTGLVGVGAKDEGGVCSARSSLGQGGIARGHSAAFRMQISAKGAQRSAGAVGIQFADGRKASVLGVELPHPESVGDKLIPLVGLGAVGVIWIVLQALRKKKRFDGSSNGD